MRQHNHETSKPTRSLTRRLLRALGLIDMPQSVRNAGRRLPQARLAVERLRVRTQTTTAMASPARI
jgi:hypothetical protein